MRTLLVLALALVWPVTGPASAQTDFPARPIKIVVPYPAGAVNDGIARIVAERLRQTFTAGVIVENRPGAGGSIGTDYVTKAAPDGYTLLLEDAMTLLPAVKVLPYSAADLTPIFGLGTSPFALAIRADLPARTFDELVALAKRTPEAIKFGNTALGGPLHAGIAVVQERKGVAFTLVPYRGMAPGLVDMIAGHIDMVLVSPSTIAPFIESGKARALMIAADQRNPALPDTPTSAEVGLSDILIRATIGILAPKGVPKPVLDRLETEIGRVANSESFQKQLSDLKVTPSPLPTEAYRNRLSQDRDFWNTAAQRLNIKFDG
ncbi:Bug family tripartite tricarboxylate transporter substrate binding protein [Bosea thiooxidans]|nr:tripartite tricarboxylate transporter substrate binding protein [Bosea sp. (in: a-proteobacteria)]